MEILFLITLQVVLTISTQRLDIVHTNNLLAWYQTSFDDAGNPTPLSKDKMQAVLKKFSLINRTVQQIKNDADGEMIFVHSGDSSIRIPDCIHVTGEDCARMINAMSPHAIAFAEYDFIDGETGLESFLKNLTVPILGCNIKTDQRNAVPSLKKIKPSMVFPVGHFRVLVIGYASPLITLSTTYRNIVIKDELTSIRTEIKKYLQSSYDIVLALGHSREATDELIAKKLPEVAAVVGGFSDEIRTQYPMYITRPFESLRIPILRSSDSHIHLNCLSLYIMGLNIVDSKPYERHIQEPRSKYKHDKIPRKKRQGFGTTKVTLEAAMDVCRYRECTLGNMITDAFFRTAVVNHDSLDPSLLGTWTLANLAMMRGGDLQGNIDANTEITLDVIKKVYPKEEPLFIATVYMRELVKLLTSSVKLSVTHGAKRFVQQSGLRTVYNRDILVRAQVLCRYCDIAQYHAITDRRYNIIVVESLLIDILDIRRSYNQSKNLDYYMLVNVTNYKSIEDYLKVHNPVMVGITERIKYLKTSIAEKDNCPIKYQDCDYTG